MSKILSKGKKNKILIDQMDKIGGDFTIQFNSDIAKENDGTRVSFYANIGFFIELAQMFEFNLRKLLCYELSVKEIEQGELTKERVVVICNKYDEYYNETYTDKWTLGKLKEEVKKLSSLQIEVCNLIQEINDYRILIVHKIFQNNIISNKLNSAKNVQDYIDMRLMPMINKASAVNKCIVKIIKLYRDDLRAYKKQVGIEVFDN